MLKQIIALIVTIGLVTSTGYSQDNIRNDGRYLIILDIQSKFYTVTEIEAPAKEMIQTVNEITSRFDPDNVIYVKASGRVLTISLTKIKVDTMSPSELDNELKIVSGNIFTKCEGDAFTVNELNQFLESRGTREIIITGLLAEKCVSMTALGGLKKGYDVFIIPEAVIGKTVKKKEKALKKLEKKGVKLLSM